MRPIHRPLGLSALGRSDGRGCGQVRQDLQSQANARPNAPSLLLQLQPPHQELPRYQAVHKRQAGQMGHQGEVCVPSHGRTPSPSTS